MFTVRRFSSQPHISPEIFSHHNLLWILPATDEFFNRLRQGSLNWASATPSFPTVLFLTVPCTVVQIAPKLIEEKSGFLPIRIINRPLGEVERIENDWSLEKFCTRSHVSGLYFFFKNKGIFWGIASWHGIDRYDTIMGGVWHISCRVAHQNNYTLQIAKSWNYNQLHLLFCWLQVGACTIEEFIRIMSNS